MLLLLLLLLSSCQKVTAGICAGCAMEQEITSEYKEIGKKTFQVVQQSNKDILLGKYATIEQIKTQVVAGIFYTFVLKSSLDEQVEIKLFRSLPSGTTPRKISYEVSYAILKYSPIHNAKSDNSAAGSDLILVPEDDSTTQTTVPLETRGASWSTVVVEEKENNRRNLDQNQMNNDPCDIRTDDINCIHVPNCKDGTVTYENFKLTNVQDDELATDQTNGKLCWDNIGIKVQEMAKDKHVFTPWKQCNDPVFERSSVLEIFVAPVQKVTDNPQWYFELDTSPSGALWAGLSNNSRGNSSTCVSTFGCQKAGTLNCTGGLDEFAYGLKTNAFNTSTGWGIEMTIPFELFAPEFQPTTRIVKNKIPHSLWRINFYRYAYPNGPNNNFTNYELSGWSSTHDPSFHVPARFGIVVLDPMV